MSENLLASGSSGSGGFLIKLWDLKTGNLIQTTSRNVSNLVNLDLYGQNMLISASKSFDIWRISANGLELIEEATNSPGFYTLATIGGGQGAKCKNCSNL